MAGSIITQDHTWSGLNVSFENFQDIASTHGLSDGIYDLVQAFRRRSSEIQQFRWSSCRARLPNLGSDQYGQASPHEMKAHPNADVWQKSVIGSSTLYAIIAIEEIHSLCAR